MTLNQENLNYRMLQGCIEFKLFKNFVAHLLDQMNLINENDFFKQFQEYRKKHGEGIIKNFYDFALHPEKDYPVKFGNDFQVKE